MTDEFHTKFLEVDLSEDDIANMPAAGLAVIKLQMIRIGQLKKRVAELEQKLGMNSSNSSKPPSSDSPYDKQHHLKKRRQAKKAARKGRCRSCGRISKTRIPNGYQPGFGPRLSALIGELGGIEGNSRTMLQRFCSSVLGIPISAGGIQKVLNRVSSALQPYYEKIRDHVHDARVNYIDETPWFLKNKLHWLWTMGNKDATYFIIHENRSRKAFEKLISDWEGLLISDGYGLYRNGVWGRQTCLAHLIRKARELSEHLDKKIARCGTWACKELKLLNSFGKAPPNNGQWNAFYARFCQLIRKNRDRKDGAGKLVRHLENEMAHLWTFLQESKVDSTNNLAERLLRFGVLRRKRSQGSKTDGGLRFVERILSVKQTMTIQKKSSFSLLVEAITGFFQKRTPDFELLGLSSPIAPL